ncbi:hypothetical protein V1477_011973 [Vespula maculifrons]|uniref:Uncharacterized protein n=1 Tax=Vespula maculifrons TaxID=7453 RepID=A0ABD2C1F2_VESMC
MSKLLVFKQAHLCSRQESRGSLDKTRHTKYSVLKAQTKCKWGRAMRRRRLATLFGFRPKGGSASCRVGRIGPQWSPPATSNSQDNYKLDDLFGRESEKGGVYARREAEGESGGWSSPSVVELLSYLKESAVAQSGLMPNSSSHSQPVPPVGLVGNYKMRDNPQTWQQTPLALSHLD